MLKKFYAIFYLIIFIFYIDTPCVQAYPYFWTVFGKAGGPAANSVKTVSIDPGGYVWVGIQGSDIGRQDGLMILDPMHEFIPPYDTSDGLAGNLVRDIAFEHVSPEFHNDLKYGSAWIATANGISVLDRKGVFTTLSSGNSPLPGNNITSIYINKQNTKWISVWGRGVCCLDSDFNWGFYTTADGLCSKYILSIKEDSNGNIWFGSNKNGVSRLDPEGNWIHFSSANSGLIGNTVREIVEDPPNRIWFVTPDGISVFNGQNWMSYTSRNSPIGNFIPTSMAIDKSGNKWIGTERGGIFKMDSFGMWTQFHQDNTALPDNMINTLVVDGSGSVWAGTQSGLCRIGSSAPEQQYVLPDKGLQKPSSPSLGKGTYYPFEQAIMWQNIGDSELKTELSLSLPTFFYGGKSWYYAVFWADMDFSFKDLQYSIVGDRRGNMKLKLSGNFSKVEFLACGGTLSSHSTKAIDKKLQYPFPLKYPQELEPFLMPGNHIPSSDPEIAETAQSLIRPESRGDMYKTIRDIVYSKKIQHIALDHKSIGLLTEKELGEEDARISVAKDVYYVLNKNTGDPHSKARLICTLARAAGIPARVVMSMKGSVWSQVWISGLGWTPVEASYPVYDYVRPLRTYMPKISTPAEYAVAAVSGRDDDVGRVLWDPQIKAYYVKSRASELNNYAQLSKAKLLLMKIVSEGTLPDNAMIQMDKDVFVAARLTEDRIVLVFQDSGGRLIEKKPLSFGGLSCFVNIQNRLFWKFIPRRIGEILVVENLEFRSLPKTPQSTGPSAASLPFKELTIQ